MRILGAIIAVIFLAFAGFAGLYLGFADLRFRSGTPPGVAVARRLVPENATYFDADSTDGVALRHAVAANPRSARTWMELGLQAEASGNHGEAERCLLAAAGASRTYQPAWTLANFYFRRGEPGKFWPWAKRAAEMAYFTQTALFRLCQQVNRDPSVVLARAIPDKTQMLAQYFAYLLQEGELDGMAPVAQKLLPVAGPDRAGLFTSYCDRLNAQGRTGDAVRMWNQVCERRLLPFAPLDPAQGRSLTNGEFATAPGAGGFDWRLTMASGVSLVTSASPTALRISFSGKQPEQLRLLQQLLPVVANRAYHLTYSVRGLEAPDQTGVRWLVSDPHGRLLASAELRTNGEPWSEGGMSFQIPPGSSGLVQLSLEYSRPPGSTRIEGDLWLRQVRLEFDRGNPTRDSGSPPTPNR